MGLGLLWAARRGNADPPASQPAPLLDQISQETQNLFQSVRPCLVRVKLPPPQWIAPFASSENPVQKWNGRLDPAVIAALQEAQMRAAAGRSPDVGALIATSQPTTSSAMSSPALPPGTHALFFTRPDGESEFIARSNQPYDAGISGMLSPRLLGIVLDSDGHVLIPVFVEKDALENQAISVCDGNGNRVDADFVGSDRQTNLTVIKLQAPMGKPATLAGERPPDGSLVMLISPSGESGRLSVWTGGQQDRGLLILTSGEIGGIVRVGQFLSGDAIKPIAHQLIEAGRVRRPSLGVLISEAETADGHRGMLVNHVVGNSAAAAAGMKEGDIILSLAGSPVGDILAFGAAIAMRDGPTDLQVLRDGQPLTVTVNLKPPQ